MICITELQYAVMLGLWMLMFALTYSLLLKEHTK